MKNGFSEFVQKENPDFICIQETKATEDQVKDLMQPFDGYYCAGTSATRFGQYFGYGVATLSREKPISLKRTFGTSDDYPGRILISEFSGFDLFNCYFPTGAGRTPNIESANKNTKRAFYGDCVTAVKETLESGKDVILCGDFNTARDERDVANAERKMRTSGFLPEDREDIGKFFTLGMIDSFRLRNQDAGHYTWWSNGWSAKEQNLGWRIDYFLVSPGLKERIVACSHRPDVVANDHCPIFLELK